MIFDLSLRYKLPLWGSALIVGTTLLLSASFMAQAWSDLRRDVSRNALDLGHIMAPALLPSLLQDDLWRAFETISLPFSNMQEGDLAQAENLFVLDRLNRVFVSSHPERQPVMTDLADLGDEYRLFADVLRSGDADKVMQWETDEAARIIVAFPITDGGVRLGTLVITYDKRILLQRFERLLGRAALIAILALVLILPASTYWARRMTVPLVRVTERMGKIGSAELTPLDAALYPYRDEVGQLYTAYNEMVRALEEKNKLETEIVKSERLAAIGRLTAGIAHEINNPLAGLVTVVDTLKQREGLDPKILRNLDLIERGLMQIRDTVAALLVQTRVNTRPFGLADVEDIKTLLQSQVTKRHVELAWDVDIPETANLPASLIRQILINLLLNAIQAAGERGHVSLVITSQHEIYDQVSRPALLIVVRNDGALLGDALLSHLFEPFATTRESGHGLGLWVTYQIVSQLNGRITARNIDAQVEFSVKLPLGSPECNTASL